MRRTSKPATGGKEARAAPSASRPAGLAEGWTVLAVCLFLVAVIWVVFGRTTRFGFVNYDDGTYVSDNALVTGGLTPRGVAWAWTHVICNFYHPLTMLSLMLDFQFHKLNAGGYHLTNVLIHTASSVLLFLVLRRMTGALWRSAFVAAVFAIHPLRVESVAWVTERKDVLATFFFMLTLGAYVRYVRQPNSMGRYMAVAGFFVLGLLCKPTAVTLPFLLLLLDYWPLGRMGGIKDLEFRIENGEIGTTDGHCAIGAGWEKRVAAVPFWGLVREKIPLAALAAGACVATYFTEAGGKALASIAALPMPLRMENVLVSYVVYLRQMVWPAGLAVYYPFPAKAYPLWETALAFLLLAVISGGTLALGRKRPWLLVGWFWYLGMLVPVIGLVQVGEFAHADRNTYLPQIGLYVLLTWAAAEMSGNWRHRWLVQGGLAAAILVALVFCARTQTSYWRNSESLWSHTISCTSGNYLAHKSMGDALALKGESAEAIEQYRKALEIKPAYESAHYNLGVALFNIGNVDEAIAQFRMALQINPAPADAHNNLGLALFDKGDLEGAIAQYREALESNPDDAEVHNNLGNALVHREDMEEGIAQYRQALKIAPDNVSAHYNLGVALARKGEEEEAIAQYRKVLEINPDYAEARNNLGTLLARKGDVEGAMAQFRKALEIKPDYAEARSNLGLAFFMKGEVEAAIAHYRKALEIKPDYEEARNNLGSALLRKGDFDGAMACFQKTTALSQDKAEAWDDLGNAFLRKGDMEGAIACYRQAIENNRRSADAYADLGVALFQKGEAKEAIDAWGQSLEIKPDQLNALNNLAWSLATAQKPSCWPHTPTSWAAAAIRRFYAPWRRLMRRKAVMGWRSSRSGAP